MPRKRSQNQSKENNLSNISISSTDSTMGNNKNMYTKDGLTEAMEEMISNVEAKARQAIVELETTHATLLVSLNKNQLETNKLSDLAAIMDDSIMSTDKSEESSKLLTPVASVKRPRRSQSSCRQLPTIQESPALRPGRSSSVGASFKTPAAMRLAAHHNAMMTASKYTVKKPCDRLNPVIPVKRVMRAGEEAISTSGSPLFVQSRVPAEPEVNIPLQNGMIMKIDLENTGTRAIIPQLDEHTKDKIKILCSRLQECISNSNN